MLSFPAATEMFQFAAFASRALCIQARMTFRSGCPIRISQDRSSVTSSPGLFAGSYVLHRLLTPRHPSHALIDLIASTECRPHAISRMGWTGFNHGSTCMMEPQAGSVLSCTARSRLGAHISVRLLTARAHHKKPAGIPKETIVFTCLSRAASRQFARCLHLSKTIPRVACPRAGRSAEGQG